jgi:hypothetical protein
MTEKIPILLLILGMTAACWFVVANRSFRIKMQRPTSRVYKLKQDQNEMYDALYFAGFLVAAIASTIFFVVACVLAILRSD